MIVTSENLPSALRDALIRSELLNESETVSGHTLSGGVSSDIWSVQTPKGTFCIKRALGKLKVEQDWYAPTSRNGFEAAWMRIVMDILPEATLPVVHEEPDHGLFIMPYLQPDDYPVWKAQLSNGDIDGHVAEEVGQRLGKIHAATYGRPNIASQFETDEIFHAIRLEPYLLATAKRHPVHGEKLRSLAAVTAAHKTCLVHGDVSPKNILVGPNGPLFIDAECAWYGDPAFDVAFCLNHLLLKAFLATRHRDELHAAFLALSSAYENAVHITGEAQAIMRRVAALLPGLFLARVDGKSPVEYILTEDDRDRVRRTASEFLTSPVDHPDQISSTWHLENR